MLKTDPNNWISTDHSVLNGGLDIDLLDTSAASHIYPQFRFQNASIILHDNTSGVIAAKESIDKLTVLIIKNGVKLNESTEVFKIDSSQDPIKITTNKGEVFTERLVITTGARIIQLVPELNSRITAIKQTVVYFKLRGPKTLYQIGPFPCWASIGDEENQVFYGLPEFGYKGIKVAQHVTVGKRDDPDEKITAADSKRIEALENFVKDNFVQAIDRVVKSETCFYANTSDENFIIDLLPNDKRIAVGSVCSGHGFKFAPLTGRLLAELVLNGRTTVAEFEESREAFSIIR